MATQNIGSVAVIGAGTMGRGIAAHLANAHIPVHLLDIVPDDLDEGEDRNQVARESIAQMLKDRPPAVFTRELTEFITPGNIEDHLDRLADVDWVVEAVPENMEIKRRTFDAIEEHASPEAIISSNTSGLSIADMLEGRSEDFKGRFLVTHFFNPVRVMKLLELVECESTSPDVLDTMVRFGRDVLGKGIVFAKDTTNFIANRIGVHDQVLVIDERERFGLSFEDVDQILREPMARPSSAMFKLCDIIGIDTFVHVADNCYDSLVDDEERDLFQVPDYVREMVERGMTGRKAGEGFYTMTDEGVAALRLDDWSYELRDFTEYESVKAAKGSPAERVHAVVVEGDDEAAEFARAVTLKTVAYAARRLGEIADDIVNIDRAMRWGFNWDLGPFELWDAIGLQWGLEQMKADGIDVPDWVEEMVEDGVDSFYVEDGVVELYFDPTSGEYQRVPVDERKIDVDVVRKTRRNLLHNDGATLHDMGDGVALMEFHTKMNAINDDIIDLLGEAIELVEDGDWRGMVVGNDGSHFSAGADLKGLLEWSKEENWDAIEDQSRRFQTVTQRLRFSTKPVVTAPHGYTLGGGAEVTMSGDVIQASAELSMGLVEVGVGLIPGAGGNLQLLRKVYGPYSRDRDIDALPFVQKVFDQISRASMARSADGARDAGFLSEADHVTLNPDQLLHAAKQQVIALAEGGYRPPQPMKFRLPGPDGVAVLDMLMYNWVEGGHITAYDRHIGKKLARVLCGGDTSPAVLVTEQHILDLAREAFLSLTGEEKTRARMEHMLKRGKPLRN